METVPVFFYSISNQLRDLLMPPFVLCFAFSLTLFPFQQSKFDKCRKCFHSISSCRSNIVSIKKLLTYLGSYNLDHHAYSKTIQAKEKGECCLWSQIPLHFLPKTSYGNRLINPIKRFFFIDTYFLRFPLLSQAVVKVFLFATNILTVSIENEKSRSLTTWAPDQSVSQISPAQFGYGPLASGLIQLFIQPNDASKSDARFQKWSKLTQK